MPSMSASKHPSERPVLSGAVRVDGTGPAVAAALDAALGEIRRAGWRVARIGEDGAGIDAIPQGVADLLVCPAARAAPILQSGRPPACGLLLTGGSDAASAALPCLPESGLDGFAILQALGGGGIERALAESVTAGTPVERVLVGLNWTLVRAGGYCGVARSPDRGTEGARSLRGEGTLRGRPLAEIARMLLSLDPLARSVGLAAANAFWNRPAADTDRCATGAPAGFARFQPPGEGLAVVGGFAEVRRRLPRARIIEREPRDGEVPAERAEEALAAARQVAITAQTLMNGSLERLLTLSSGASIRMLIGPSAPLCPSLFAHGLTDISGIVVEDPERLETFIAETGARILEDGMVRSTAIAA